MKTTGPHHVKFIAEPLIVMGMDDEGKPRKMLRFEVQEKGNNYRWMVPLLGKDGQPHYLIERLLEVKVNDERILEMMRRGARNYIDVRKSDEAPEPPEEIEDEEAQEELAKALKKEQS